MFTHTVLVSAISLFAGILAGQIMAAESETWDGTIVQYGTMHEAIGAQQHQGRVQLKKLVKQPHFFGVAALERLEGEATIYDGKVTITRVDSKGQLEPVEPAPLDDSATLLVGAYVPSWGEHEVTTNVPADQFDPFVENQAAKAGVKTSQPFVFTVEGEFSNLRLHVINGACPMHARLKKIEVPKERRAR